MCLVEGCIISKRYNFKGELPEYCKRHKKDGMINVKDKRCIYPECIRGRSYGKIKGGAMYCSKHKLKGMIHKNLKYKMIIRDKWCIRPECTKNRLYGNPNEPPIYCKNHSLEGMINTLSKRCIDPGCTTIPAYAEEGKTAMYCIKHKKTGMINVVRNTCMNCNKTALYNKKGERPMFCSKHKEEGMIDVIHKKCLKCEYTANYGLPNSKPLYCSGHSLDGMIDTRLKKCKTHLCDTYVKNKYKGYCYYCFVHLFPDSVLCKNYKTKERCVAEYIQSHSTYPWICDKKIQDGCSRRRPDLMVDLGFQVIIVEIDENQHIHYDTTCENKRMMELSQDVGHRPIVMIRFNPDEYTDTEKHSSCWCLDVHGLCQLKKSKEKEWNNRLEVLMEQINLWTTKPTEKTIEVIQLFYSE
jgi:hypothetical protein